MQVSKATSRIRRLFASLRIHYNNSQKILKNRNKQKNKEMKKFRTKVVNSMIFRIPCNTCFK